MGEVIEMDNEIKVTRSSMAPFEEYTEEIRSLWESHWLTNFGAKHEELTEKLKEYMDVDNLELFVNGHMALELSFAVLGLSEGEVITTPFSFVSTTHSIVRNGLTPVFCDINPVDYTIDADRIEELITGKTVAIMPVHVYGNICRIDKIQEIADRHGLKVIYDAAHTFGETYKGSGVGSFGDISCFSFHATKVYHTIEGGAVCYRDPELEPKVTRIRDFGIATEDEVSYIGANAKMNEFSAAMGLCNLRHVDEEIEKRRKVSDRYRERLTGIAGLKLNSIQKEVKPNYAYFPIVFEKEIFGAGRDEVFESLKKNGIGARKYFYPLISEMDCYKSRYNSEETPVALNISKNVLTVPMYADLNISDVDRICDIILSCR